MTVGLDQLEQDAFGSFWQRVGAYAADSFLLTFVLLFVAATFILPDTPPTELTPEETIELGNTINLAGVIISWLYFAAMESSPMQATLGKKFFGLKVVDLDGNKISFPRALLRVAAKIISALPLFAGFLMVAFTAHRQGLHDLIAGTYVVKTQLAGAGHALGSPSPRSAQSAMKEELSAAYKNVLKDYGEKRAAKPQNNVVDRKER